jgi:hypothetical protein
MADLLARIKIPAKIMGLLLMLGLITLGVVLLWFARAQKTDDYAVLVNTKLPITTNAVNRLCRSLYASYRVMAYPGGSAAGRAAADEERRTITRRGQADGSRHRREITTTRNLHKGARSAAATATRMTLHAR